MSNDTRVPSASARPLAEALVAQMQDVCARVEIAGSLRRGKASVGDIEIVALPRHREQLLARLDMLVHRGDAQQAIYSDGKKRWGERYRGLRWRGMKAEVFIAEPDSWGYILWLRTGPGDANHYVMTQIARHNAPFRFTGGFALADAGKIAVEDERALFGLLGMPVIAPAARSIEAYMQYLEAPRWGRFSTVAVDAPPAQTSLW